MTESRSSLRVFRKLDQHARIAIYLQTLTTKARHRRTDQLELRASCIQDSDKKSMIHLASYIYAHELVLHT